MYLYIYFILFIYLSRILILFVEISYNEYGAYFILLHPVVRSRCCFANCQYNSNEIIGSRITNSFESHLFTKPGIIAKRKWRCAACSILLFAHRKRLHTCESDISHLSFDSHSATPSPHTLVYPLHTHLPHLPKLTHRPSLTQAQQLPLHLLSHVALVFPQKYLPF